MSDLISKSALIDAIVNSSTECLKEYSVSSVANAIAYGSATRQNEILDIINEQPTAFDLDKVVEELEEELSKKHKLFLRGDRDEIRYLYEMQILKYAIEIVRKGGVEPIAQE